MGLTYRRSVTIECIGSAEASWFGRRNAGLPPTDNSYRSAMDRGVSAGIHGMLNAH